MSRTPRNEVVVRCAGCRARLDVTANLYCRACERLIEAGTHPREARGPVRRKLLKLASQKRRKAERR